MGGTQQSRRHKSHNRVFLLFRIFLRYYDGSCLLDLPC
jgi:hypothetical protein